MLDRARPTWTRADGVVDELGAPAGAMAYFLDPPAESERRRLAERVTRAREFLRRRDRGRCEALETAYDEQRRAAMLAPYDAAMRPHEHPGGDIFRFDHPRGDG